MDRAEQQLRLIQAVYRSETVRQRGEAFDQLRARCLALLDKTSEQVDGDLRLQTLVEEIRSELQS